MNITSEIRELKYVPGTFGAFAVIEEGDRRIQTTFGCSHCHHTPETASKCEPLIVAAMRKIQTYDRVIMRSEDNGTLVEMRDHIDNCPDTGRERFNSVRFWEIEESAVDYGRI